MSDEKAILRHDEHLNHTMYFIVHLVVFLPYLFFFPLTVTF